MSYITLPSEVVSLQVFLERMYIEGLEVAISLLKLNTHKAGHVATYWAVGRISWFKFGTFTLSTSQPPLL